MRLQGQRAAQHVTAAQPRRNSRGYVGSWTPKLASSCLASHSMSESVAQGCWLRCTLEQGAPALGLVGADGRRALASGGRQTAAGRSFQRPLLASKAGRGHATANSGAWDVPQLSQALDQPQTPSWQHPSTCLLLGLWPGVLLRLEFQAWQNKYCWRRSAANIPPAPHACRLLERPLVAVHLYFLPALAAYMADHMADHMSVIDSRNRARGRDQAQKNAALQLPMRRRWLAARQEDHTTSCLLLPLLLQR